MGIKSYIKDNSKRYGNLLEIYSRFLGHNKIRTGKGNSFRSGSCLIKGCRIEIKGTGNEIHIGELSQLCGCTIYVQGSNNRIEIGNQVFLNHTELWIENEGNRLQIGNHTSMDGKKESPDHLAVIEGTCMEIGEDCMLSNGIEIRTGDSHSVLDGAKRRINPSKNVRIGNHVWIGTRAMILKGTEIGTGCVVGAGSLVTGKHPDSHCVLAGNPAKAVRLDVDWCRERV